MKFFLPAFFLLISFSAAAQTVNISGRCYYDVNGNHIFDATDSIVPYGLVEADGNGGPFFADLAGTGSYNLELPVGSYTIGLYGADIDYRNYKDIGIQYRDYSIAGSDVIDFAYQKRDSIETIYAFVQAVDNIDYVSSAGGSRKLTLMYAYDGSLQNMPAKITLKFNPSLTFISSSPLPTVTGSGSLEWNFPNVQRRELFTGNNAFDSIRLTFNFPAAGDTIGSFKLSPAFIPGVSVTNIPYKYVTDAIQYIHFPDMQPTGPTSGVKWLRHFLDKANSNEEGISIDTARGGETYFIAGARDHEYDSAFNQQVPFIAKLNKDGLSIWEKYIDSLPGNYPFSGITSIRHTNDGGCIILGDYYSNDSLNNYQSGVAVVVFDSIGNLKWSRTLTGSGYNYPGIDIAVLSDGNFLITGATSSVDGDFTNSNIAAENANVFVTKLSSVGNVIFTKVYGGSEDDYGLRIVPLQNGSFIVLGSTQSNDGDVSGAHEHEVVYTDSLYTEYTEEAWILNLDANGNILWSKCFGGSKYSYLPGAAENNGGIMLTGFTNSKDGDLPYYPEQAVSLWALQISNAGNIIWSKLHKIYKGYQDTNYIASPGDIIGDNLIISGLHKSKDGNFIVGGTVSDRHGEMKNTHGETDFILLKINTTGDIIWQKSVGGTSNEYLNDLQVDKNDDILFAGSSHSDNDDLYQHPTQYQELMVIGKAGITNIIKGQVFIDNNGNHLKDAGERDYSQGRINSIKRTDTIVARIFDGRFLNNVDTGTYISSYIPANNYYTIFSANRTTNFAGLDMKDSFDFALTPKPNINDLEIQLLPLSTPRPGFDAMYRIITKNVGTTTIGNVVIGLKKDGRQNYINASRPYTGIQADSIWWGPFTLNAFDIDTLYVSVTLASPPVLNNGDTISLSVTAYPIINDSSAANNVFISKERVRGSFDPNDKTEIHAGTLTTTQYAGGEYLQYQIRFQNTGTDTAFFITVKDTLQSTLDLSKLEIVSASHPYSFRLNGSVATWDFKNIKLPDSTTDEPASHGFISFKVKPKTGLTVGDEFTNKAAIYFDYNLPVITNQDNTVLGVKPGICPNSNVSFTAGISGTSYQWQVNTGAGFTNINNSAIYTGVSTATLSLTAPPTSMYGYKYRCIINGTIYSPENSLKFTVRWNGSASTAWENAINWDCGVLPDAKTDVIIPAGVRYPLVSSNASCYSLRLSPGSIVSIKTGFNLIITGKAN